MRRLLSLSFCFFFGHQLLAAEGKADVIRWKYSLEQARKGMAERNSIKTKSNFETALKEAEKFPDADIRKTETFVRYGEWLFGENKPGQAEPLLYSAVAQREKAHGTNHLQVAACLSLLGAVYLLEEKNDEGQTALERAKYIFAEKAGAQHPYVGMVESQLAGLYRDIGKYYLSEPLFKSALEKVSSSMYRAGWATDVTGGPVAGLIEFNPDPRFEANVRNSLGLLYKDMGEFDKAIEQFAQSIKLWENEMSKTDLSLTTYLYNLGFVATKAEKYGEAEKAFKRSLSILEKHKVGDHEVTRLTLLHLQFLAQKKGDAKQAQLYADKLKALPKKSAK
jgi:tetratricopeptide (TPR) repeat protein